MPVEQTVEVPAPRTRKAILLCFFVKLGLWGGPLEYLKLFAAYRQRCIYSFSLSLSLSLSLSSFLVGHSAAQVPMMQEQQVHVPKAWVLSLGVSGVYGCFGLCAQGSGFGILGMFGA